MTPVTAAQATWNTKYPAIVAAAAAAISAREDKDVARVVVAQAGLDASQRSISVTVNSVGWAGGGASSPGGRTTVASDFSHW